VSRHRHRPRLWWRCYLNQGASGEGDSPEAAVADLREALTGLIAEFAIPEELTLTVDVA